MLSQLRGCYGIKSLKTTLDFCKRETPEAADGLELLEAASKGITRPKATLAATNEEGESTF
jgi:hypothetical protein